MGKCIAICAVITFLVLGGVAVLTAWSVDKMKNPSFSINQAAIDSYKLASNDHLEATFTLVVRSHNRDPKYNIKYNSVTVAIFHDAYSLAYVTDIGPYTQHHGEDLVFMAQPLARNITISDSDVAVSLRKEVKAGQLKLEVRIRAYVRFEVKRWKRKRYTFGIVCAPLLIDFVSGKSSEGINCDVDRF